MLRYCIAMGALIPVAVLVAAVQLADVKERRRRKMLSPEERSALEDGDRAWMQTYGF